MMYLALIAAVSVAVSQAYNVAANNGGGREWGTARGQLGRTQHNYGDKNREQWSRDHQGHQGNLGRSAVWTGRAADRDDAWRHNQQQFRDQAAGKNRNYANSNNNFGNIVNQIRDEGLRHAYKITDGSKYARNDQEQASGYNGANARKNAFDRGSKLDDNINYQFNKKFNKQSSENGGFEDENGRKFTKVDLIDEREKDRALKRNDNIVHRKQNDKQQVIKENDWRANANQKRANGGQYGFGDRRLEAAGERSDERAIDYNRKDNQFRENEQGVDSAIRLAKDLAEEAAGYRNEAGANADSARTVKDAKFYGGEQSSPNSGYGAATNGPKSRQEGSGGRINSGFEENADQKERGEELARATALSAADARNEYQRLKDRVKYDEVKGLKDRANGAFKQGLSDTKNQGFSSNAAEAAKHSDESDKKFEGSASASDFAAKQNAVNEALRDRDYYLKKQNDENETFTRRKQFFHNKKEGGANDEQLKYDRKKNAREYGAAEEADLAKHNQFAKAVHDAKKTAQERTFEDSKSERAQLQHQQEDRQQEANGHEKQGQEEAARAGSNVNSLDRTNSWKSSDDSRSDEKLKKNILWEGAQASNANEKNALKLDQNTLGEVEVINLNSAGPFGRVSSSNLVGGNVFAPLELKKKKEKKIPDIVIDIPEPRAPTRFRAPNKKPPIPDLPPVKPVKPYKPPKYNKKHVDYSHKFQPSQSRSRDQAILHNVGFQRINSNLFTRRPQNQFSSINSGLTRGAATSAFKKPSLFNNNHSRLGLGSLTRHQRYYGGR